MHKNAKSFINLTILAISHNFYLFGLWNILRKFAENTYENFQKGDDLMSREAQSYVKGAAAAVVTGGIAVLAVRSLTNNKRLKRKMTAKTFKAIGNIMDSL